MSLLLRRVDRLCQRSLAIAALSSLFLLSLIFAFIVRESSHFLRDVSLPAVLRAEHWHPTAGEFQFAPMLLGSVASALGALLLSLPLAIMIAASLHVYCRDWQKKLIKQILFVLMGIPSVVYGFWGLTTIVPLLSLWRPPGASLLAAILVLGAMILPSLTQLLEQSFGQYSQEENLATHALGLGPFRRFLCLCYPQFWMKLGRASALSFGRAIGETMAVLMVAGNIVAVPHSLFDPIRSLTANIALEMAYALDTHRSALFFGALLLLIAHLCLLLSQSLPLRKKRDRRACH